MFQNLLRIRIAWKAELGGRCPRTHQSDKVTGSSLDHSNTQPETRDFAGVISHPQTLPPGGAGNWGPQAGPWGLVGESGGNRDRLPSPTSGAGKESWEGKGGWSPHSRGQRPDAAARHVEEGAGAGPGAQGGLDASEQVVGLEEEQHLAGHMVEELADLGEVVGRIVADLRVLKQQQRDRRGELEWTEGPRAVDVRAAWGGEATRTLQEGAPSTAASGPPGTSPGGSSIIRQTWRRHLTPAAEQALDTGQEHVSKAPCRPQPPAVTSTLAPGPQACMDWGRKSASSPTPC